MQKFKFECSCDAKGLEDFNSFIAALHTPKASAMFDYNVEYNLSSADGKVINRVWWWKKQTGVQR